MPTPHPAPACLHVPRGVCAVWQEQRAAAVAFPGIGQPVGRVARHHKRAAIAVRLPCHPQLQLKSGMGGLRQCAAGLGCCRTLHGAGAQGAGAAPKAPRAAAMQLPWAASPAAVPSRTPGPRCCQPHPGTATLRGRAREAGSRPHVGAAASQRLPPSFPRCHRAPWSLLPARHSLPNPMDSILAPTGARCWRSTGPAGSGMGALKEARSSSSSAMSLYRVPAGMEEAVGTGQGRHAAGPSTRTRQQTRATASQGRRAAKRGCRPPRRTRVVIPAKAESRHGGSGREANTLCVSQKQSPLVLSLRCNATARQRPAHRCTAAAITWRCSYEYGPGTAAGVATQNDSTLMHSGWVPSRFLAQTRWSMHVSSCMQHQPRSSSPGTGYVCKTSGRGRGRRRKGVAGGSAPRATAHPKLPTCCCLGPSPQTSLPHVAHLVWPNPGLCKHAVIRAPKHPRRCSRLGHAAAGAGGQAGEAHISPTAASLAAGAAACAAALPRLAPGPARRSTAAIPTPRSQTCCAAVSRMRGAIRVAPQK